MTEDVNQADPLLAEMRRQSTTLDGIRNMLLWLLIAVVVIAGVFLWLNSRTT